MPDARVVLGSGGGDGIDTAAKLARRYWTEVGAPERVHLISRSAAYHGTHGLDTAFTGIEANREGYGTLLGEQTTVRHDSVADLEAAVTRIGPERVAAFFVKPVIGAGGVYPPPEGYLQAVAAICRRTGVLLVADAVICGFGRLGSWFGIERFGLEPDMVVFGKGVTSGYQPLGGVVVSGRVAEPFWSSPSAPVFRHGPTYAGHPAACVAALANLKVLEAERPVSRRQELERELLAALEPLADHPLVAEVRGGVGTLAAVELDCRDSQAPSGHRCAGVPPRPPDRACSYGRSRPRSPCLLRSQPARNTSRSSPRRSAWRSTRPPLTMPRDTSPQRPAAPPAS